MRHVKCAKRITCQPRGNKKCRIEIRHFLLLYAVPGEGLEPSCLAARPLKGRAYAISPPGQFSISEATVGLAPTNNGFADRSVSYFTTWPKLLPRSIAPH